jgi:hypothetical protein
MSDVYLVSLHLAKYTSTTFRKQIAFVFRCTTILRISKNLKEPNEYEFVSFWPFRVLIFLKLLVHLKTKAVCFRNVVFVYSLTIWEVQMRISDISYVTPFCKNWTVHAGTAELLVFSLLTCVPYGSELSARRPDRFTTAKVPRYALGSRLDGWQSRSGRFVATASRTAYCLDCIPSALSRPRCKAPVKIFLSVSLYAWCNSSPERVFMKFGIVEFNIRLASHSCNSSVTAREDYPEFLWTSEHMPQNCYTVFVS